VKAFPDAQDSRLREFLAAAYTRQERHEEALEIAWQSFRYSSSIDAYAALKQHAEQVGSWTHLREQALDYLRAAQTKREPVRGLSGASPTAQPRRRVAYGSEIVAILLWEGNVEAAWAEASQNGCAFHQWEKLARLRETTHLEDSLRIYEESVRRLVDQTNNPAYAEAFEYVRHIQRLLVGNGKPEQFLTYVAELRSEFGRKRNFMRLLDSIDHPPAYGSPSHGC